LEQPGVVFQISGLNAAVQADAQEDDLVDGHLHGAGGAVLDGLG